MGSCRIVISVVFAIFLAYCVKFYAEKNPNTESFLSRTTNASNSAIVRMMQAVGLQVVRSSPTCNFVEGDLKDQLILISGGNSGIGLETAKGLVKRGADVVMVGRNERKIEEAVQKIKTALEREGVTAVSLRYAVADMADLKSVAAIVPILDHFFSHRKIDQLILNAAIWPQKYVESAQGHEIAFATNTLGPHLLLRSLIDQGLLKNDARVTFLTGDIYITVASTDDEGCSPDYKYSTPAGAAGQTAYSRSKLGMMWLFDKMHSLYPSLNKYLVHPGVIGTGLAGSDNPLPKFMMLTDEEGAQTTLICATAPLSLLENGGYYHNTLGKLVLSAQDPAKNADKAAAFWTLAENLIAPYMQRASAPEPAPAVVEVAETSADASAAPAVAEETVLNN